MQPNAPHRRTPVSALAIISLLLIGSVTALAQEPVIRAAENSDPSPGPVGAKPYEMAGREQTRPQLFDFSDVTGWTAEGYGAEGNLYRSEDQKLFSDYCGKLVYKGTGPDPRLVVRPQEPITIPDPWDALNFWNYGNNWGWAPDPKTPPLQATALLRDAAGWEFQMPLGSMDYTYWFLQNSRLHAEHLARVQRPVQFLGLQFANARNEEPRTVYLGPCEFFKEEWKPLQFQPWPDKLPFPTREETILPTNYAEYENSVAAEGEATVFTYRGEDCTLQYRVTPRSGGLDDIELRFGDKAFMPCAGGGMQLATPQGTVAPDSEDLKRTLLSAESRDGELTCLWRLEAGDVATEVTYRFRLRQKSLIVEMEAADPVVERVALGRAEPVVEPKLFRLPYLTYGGNDPRVMYAEGLFLFTQFDWYVSDASTLAGAAATGPQWVAYNGAAVYVPKTNGERNPVRERLFLTASPRFEEVLPTIPNPPSPMREVQCDRLWRVKGGADHKGEIAEAQSLRNYGLDKVTIRYHEDSWRDAGESFTFRLNAAPGRGGDQALRDFVAAVQSLGWRVGLYTNYTDYAPVNSYWNEDWVARHSNGDWQRAWMRCYAPKPMRSVEMQALLAPQIQAKFGENHSYCDVHTAVTPFSRVDYDHRVPGAGTFRRTFECFGRLLFNEKTAHNGPVYSEGNNHWWYSGLTDGNYAQIISPAPPKEPLLVAFDLLKMHPLHMDAGMGSPGMFFRGAPHNLDQFIATSLAYGHIGFVDWGTRAGLLKIYYMMQAMQEHYVMVPVSRIEYDAGGQMVDTSAALVSDAYLDGRVHVVYDGGTEIYVNGSERPWTVTLQGEKLRLGPWGYAAIGGEAHERTVSYSAEVPVGGAAGGPTQRVDVALSPSQSYLDSRGGYVNLGFLAGKGSAAVKTEDNVPWVIPTDGFSDFGFRPEMAGLAAGTEIAVDACAMDGTPIGPAEMRWSRGLAHIIPEGDEPRKYRLAAVEEPAPAALEAPLLAPVGREVQVTIPEGMQADAVSWEIDKDTVAAQADADGRTLTVTVPADAAPGSLLWLAVGSGSQTLWVDFIAAQPFDVSLDVPLPAKLAQGESLPLEATVTNNLSREAEVALALGGSEGVVAAPAAATLKLPANGTGTLQAAVTLPWQVGPCSLTAEASQGESTVGAGTQLGTRWEYPVLLDLTDPAVPFTMGYCPRGGEETTDRKDYEDGSFEISKGRSGGVERNGLFSHPPYGRNRAGYAFAVYDVTLPANLQTVVEFYMGMREGLHTTDGVTYRVVVIDGEGRQTEVFSQHHGATSWEAAQADLSGFAGQKIRLKLVADCGPADDTTADHALWGDPQVVVRDERAKRLVVTAAE